MGEIYVEDLVQGLFTLLTVFLYVYEHRFKMTLGEENYNQV